MAGSGNATALVTLINQLTLNSETKANVNFYDLDGNTALAVAARKGFGSAVERLLDLGANPNATNWAGKSGKPFHQTQECLENIIISICWKWVNAPVVSMR